MAARRIGVFEVKDKDLGGRIGRLYTPHGVLETPALFPVVDPLRQEVSIDDIRRVGFNAVITNAYLLWRRSRHEAASRGVHAILGFDGIVMTDSGAYQLLRYGRVEVTPDEIIEFQKKIGSDIAVILDVPTGVAQTKEEARQNVEETLRRARAAVNMIKDDERIWVLPIQGGPYPDLVEYSARESSKLAEFYQMLALGSPTVLLERYSYDRMVELIALARINTPLSKPLHLFGAGHPMIIPFAVALGVDTFDSASYILYARDERYMTSYGTHRLEDMDYFPCSCPICTRYTPQELREMPRHERVRLLALHNLYVLRQEINRVKLAIREGRLWELLVEKAHAHPSLRRALQVLTRYSDYIEKLDPRVKGGEVHGIFLYGIPEEFERPEVKRHYKLVATRYKPRSTLVLVPIDIDDKPFTASRRYTSISPKHPDASIVAYAPILGLIPEELSETYPLSQFEAPKEYPRDILEKTAERIAGVLESWKPDSITIYVCREEQWSSQLARLLVQMLEKQGFKLEVRALEEC